MDQEGMAVPLTELIPPGIYPIWSPHDASEAAIILLVALAEETPFMEERNANTTC